MKKLLFLSLFVSFGLHAQDKSGHHVILLNGGHDIESNFPRYYENIKSMYEAFRENEIESKNISVFYGSGKVEDTYVPRPPTFEEFKLPELKIPEYPLTQKKPSLFGLGFSANDTDSNESEEKKDYKFSLTDLFNGEEKTISGEAKQERLKEKLAEFQKNLKPGDNISLFITDHGDIDEEKDESMVNLWGEKMSTSELKGLLQQVPDNINIRVITNICYGGGLNELTSKNICVYANQEKDSPSYSKSDDLDLYAQNFAFALKNKVDFDKDGKATYLDAHEYAISLEDKRNHSVTSLDWFLLNTRGRILSLKGEQEFQGESCIAPEDESLKNLSYLIEDFSALKKSMLINEEIPASRQHLFTPRLQRKLSLLKKHDSFVTNESIEIKLEVLRKELEKSALNWDKLSPNEQELQRKKANLEAQQLQSQVNDLESLKYGHRNANFEMDLIRYGDQKLIEEYESIIRCLEYAY